MKFTILIVDDEIEICLSLAELLEAKGYKVQHCQDPLKVINIIKTNQIDLIIMDIKMPELNGIDLLKKISLSLSNIPIIMISGHATVDKIVTSMKYGAINFYTKPIDNKALFNEIKLLSDSYNEKRHQVNKYCDIISINAEMKKVMGLVEKAAPTLANVIITGESGTGKELIADSLHYLSPRKSEPYIKINCAAIPENLLESEMFGYEPGAFTGAKDSKMGKFELAKNGTIFLDEIGDMSARTQAKMLRVLQDKVFSRIGGTGVIQSNCRIITATNKDLSELIKADVFREDLFYRLNVISIDLPPLRKRKEDIVPLTQYFLTQFAKTYNKKISRLSDEVKSLLMQHDWPGNIRELKNLIERAVIFCERDRLDIDSISQLYNKLNYNSKNDNLKEKYELFERDVIIEALEKSNYVKQKAAELLNIDRRTLYNKLKKLNIKL